MIEFVRRHNLALTSFGLIVCSFQLMSLSIEHQNVAQIGGKVVNSVVAPVEKVHREIIASGRHLWSHYLWLIDVETERNDLVKRVKALEAQNSRFIEIENENVRLQKLLNFVQTTNATGVAATVIARDPSNWVRSITIDKGAEDGLRPGQPVVDGHAIVGQTTVVNATSAKVQLLTDNSSAIDAIIQRTRSPGSAEGTLSEVLKLRYIDKEQVVALGDRVIASGLDGVFPKGALIGVVSAVNAESEKISMAEQPEGKPQSGGLFQEVMLEPSVRVDTLETVYVVMAGGEVAEEAPAPEATSQVESAPMSAAPPSEPTPAPLSTAVPAEGAVQ